ncbi:HAD family hydrolase [Actinomadura macrotermitis]|uniref:Pyrimidine 5'-nucleotidase YjjG n=1 Tax=Actinomadura macrotermitis TaxID=2585200 RepID=A0A7K0BYH7_9ACTN|nr:HAD family hydrolase [Actinomadura macrotermitis]MQY06233.1 Pyrimidine 5'-nucleotidase YjjG [Actinomadura macrotermitis]
MPIDAVLFDLDDTLLDHGGAAAAAITGAFPGGPAWLAARWTELVDESVDRYLSGELTWPDQRRYRITRLARELGLGEWDAARADAWFAAEYVPRYEAAWRAFPDVEPALAALAGRRLGVITNGYEPQQRGKLRRLGLAGALPYLLASSTAGAAKPAPEIFRTACAELGLPPERVAYVGDRLATDAVGATEAGLYGVWLDRPGSGGAADVPRITSLAELPDLLG